MFDEAHNIDNVCIESLSTDITEDSLRKATRGAQNLENKIAEMRDSDADKLKNEYAKLVEGLRDADEARQEDAFMSNPGVYFKAPGSPMLIMITALPDDLLKEAVPGNIRRAEHFIAFLKRFIEYLKVENASSCSNQEDSNKMPDQDESSSSHLGNTAIIFGTSQGVYIYREEAIALLRREIDFPCPNP